MLGKYESLDFEEEQDFVALAENTGATVHVDHVDHGALYDAAFLLCFHRSSCACI
eukprot:SAG22_NODE_1043_length_5882_cov_148.833132_3_plen_55_part_00